MNLSKQEIDAIARKVVRLQEKPPSVPFHEWYTVWENNIDGAYTVGCAIRALQGWLIANYLDGEEGVVHLEPISRKRAEEDVHWAVESFNEGQWPEYHDANNLLDELACAPFDKFDDEVKFIEFPCYL